MNNTTVEGRGTRDESQRRALLSTRDSRLSTARQGVALIITVIMLAVVTFLAITFLAVSRRERNAVTTTTDTATAKLAADNALAAAEAQIMANTLATTNPYNFGLLVSTNFVNPAGFNPGVAGYDPLNVNYDHTVAGNSLTLDDFLQNLANLYYLPRPPVFATNYIYRTNELQFYLDLNRNGRDEANGWVTNFDNLGQVIYGYDASGNRYVSTNFEVGDPDWVGVLQHPGQPYGPNNPFVARYAFVAVPIGNALDLNAVYNQAATREVNPASGGVDGFMRNQGVGSWEINLAAFLADLNTNEWLPTVPPDNLYYAYNEPASANRGHAFEDALSLLSYRYATNYNTLRPVGGINPKGLFTSDTIFPPFQNNIDYYSDEPLIRQNVTWPWAGADNTNHFFDMQELFNPAESSPAFTNRLALANQGPSTYNRYTYYRLQSQMGVDSAPERDQINLNYSNAFAYFAKDQNGNIIPGLVTNIVYYPDAETNLTLWQPLQFFTIAADKMLQTYSEEWITESPSNYVATYGMTTNISTAANPVFDPTNVPVPFGISDIPVLVSNRFVYTPAIQRVLQLAANIYDATTNNATGGKPDYPSVFRPIFNLVPVRSPSGAFIYTNVYIAGYEPVEYNGQMGAVNPNLNADPQLNLPVNVSKLLTFNPNISDPSYPPPFGLYTNVNVYGVPWIIGAKKGFPNFNEFAMESIFQLTRKLQVTRESTNDTYVSNPDSYHFDQMFNLSLSNQLAVECWNSYTNFYQSPDGQRRSVAMYVNDALSVTLTNDEFPPNYFSYTTNFPIANSLQIPNPTNSFWPGYNPIVSPLLSPASFQIPLNTNVAVIPTSMYRFNLGNTVTEPGDPGTGQPYLTTNLDSPYESDIPAFNGSLYPQPHWWLITSNNVRVIILDTTDPNLPQVIDYVQLAGPNSVRDLSFEIMTNYDVPFNTTEPSGNELWNTNLQNGVPVGITSQIGVSDGNYTAGAASGTWDTTDPTLQQYEMAGFLAFLGYTPPPASGVEAQYITFGQTSLSNQAPYSPVATVIQVADWQANDPLVHYLNQDIDQPGIEPSFRPPIPPAPAPSLTNSAYATIGRLNTRYMPWGGYPGYPYPPSTNTDFNGQNAFNLALKDPLVWRSDDWDFPTEKLPTVGWLGRVHRGTPWQTVYLMSPDILREIQITGGTQTNYVGPSTWAQWTGDTQAVINRNANNQNVITYYDGENFAPVQDRLLFDLFTTAPNANATRGQLSVNVGASNPNNPQAGLAAWSAVLSGVQALSNNVAYPVNQHNGSMADFTTFPINPAGLAGTNSAVGRIVAGINRTRLNADESARTVWVSKTGTVINKIPAAFGNVDGLTNTFEHVGDILSVPQLSDQSPLLNWNNQYQIANGISVEMYDWLPQQILSLLRVSGTPQSPMRYVIYCYGQALKPAPNGIYTGGGPYFGMITNYQVVAESANRAVVNFGSVATNVVTPMTLTNSFDEIVTNLITTPVVTNNNARIEQFNVLPPY